MRILLIGLLLCSIGFAQDMETIHGGKGDYTYRNSQWFDVGKTGEIKVERVNADVKIIGWDQSRVEVIETAKMDVYTKEEANEIIDRFETSFSQTGSRITIRGNNHGHWEKKFFEINVPRKFLTNVRINQGSIYVEGMNETVDLRSSSGNIAVKDIDGNVKMRTSGGELEAFGVSGTCFGKTSGGNITYEDLGMESEARTSGGNIRVTNAKKTLLLKTSGGEIGVKNAGGDIDAHTNGGAIGVRDCKGDVNLRTNGGNIFLKDIVGKMLGDTNGGDIIGENLEGSLNVETNGGDIELDDIRGGVRATTHAGDIELTITSTDFSKDHTSHLKTHHGDIHVTLPSKMPLTISAQITQKSRWDRYEIYTDFPMTMQPTGTNRTTRSSGTINGGGDTMVLETSAGNIYIGDGSGTKNRKRQRMRSEGKNWHDDEEDCDC
ncbi:MAG: DUF4097 family beta strand repeat-containing protein [Calditrichia bacterium]